jgi:hypothetical protein
LRSRFPHFVESRDFFGEKHKGRALYPPRARGLLL